MFGDAEGKEALALSTEPTMDGQWLISLLSNVKTAKWRCSSVITAMVSLVASMRKLDPTPIHMAALGKIYALLFHQVERNQSKAYQYAFRSR